jgi:hypothetical protein
MQTISSQKTGKSSGRKMRRQNLRAVARREGIPEFMIRFAQKQRMKICGEPIMPKYRHD